MRDERKPPGPNPDRLKIDMPWEEAVKRVVRKNDPPKPDDCDRPEDSEGSAD